MAKSSKIKVGIIGVGNCAKSLVEGVQYYAENNKEETGVMKTDIGGYLAGDVEFVIGFDIDERKTGLGLGKALKQRPNCAWDIVDTIKCNAPVFESPVIDGYAGLMDSYPEENRFLVSEKLRNSTDMNRVSWTTKLERSWKDSIIKELKKRDVEVLVNS